MLACCVIPEWDSILVLHRKDAEAEWELPCAEVQEESPEETATKAAKALLGIDVEVQSKLGEKDDVIWFLAAAKGIPKAVNPAYDRVRYMEAFILAKKRDKLSRPLALLLDEMREGRIRIEKKASVSWKRD